MLAMFQTSPASPRVQTISQFVTAGQRREFADFTRRSCPCEACLSERGTQLEMDGPCCTGARVPGACPTFKQLVRSSCSPVGLLRATAGLLVFGRW